MQQELKTKVVVAPELVESHVYLFFESWPVGAPYQRDVENVFVLSPMGIEPYYLVFFFF